MEREQDHAGEPQPHEAELTPFGSDSGADPAAESEQAEYPTERNKWPRAKKRARVATSRGWSLFFQGLVAFATVVYVVVSGLEETRKSTRLAEKSLEFSREALEISERPWVVPFMGKQAIQISDKPGLLKLNLVNTGRTPALNLQCATSRTILSSSPAEFPPRLGGEPSVAMLGAASVAMLGAGSRGRAHVAIPPVTQGELDAIGGGGKTFYVLGECRYGDGFGRNYSFRFCYQHNPEHGEWIYCAEYNRAD